MLNDVFKVGVFLDADLLYSLRVYCEDNNVTLSQGIRQILDDYLQKWFPDDGY